MIQNFKPLLKKVLVHEGGYVNNPNDPGGATNKGVTQHTYTSWLYKVGRQNRSVKLITDVELEAIYKQEYWDKVRGDDLPNGLDYAVFDFAVNSGPSRASKFLQAIVGVKQDGVIGSNTLNAVKKFPTASLVSTLCDNRLSWLKRLSTWKHFGRGWERRVTEVKEVSLMMASSVKLTTPQEPNKSVWEKIVEFFVNLFGGKK